MKRWTTKETKQAIYLLTKEKKSYSEIAEQLEKTPKSVKVRLHKFNYSYHKEQQIEQACLNCGNKIKASLKNHKKKFCNSSCAATFNNKNKNYSFTKELKTTNCTICGKEIEVFKNTSKIHSFCDECCVKPKNNKKILLIEKISKIRTCKFCNKTLNDKKNQNVYCSQKCQTDFNWELKKIEIEKGNITYNRPLKIYMLKKNGHICEICNNTEWNGKQIPLVLDHIDGNSYNGLPNNLRLICPNCDAQTDTYKGKNKGNGRHERMKRYYEGKSY